jgi:hypothetical protein
MAASSRLTEDYDTITLKTINVIPSPPAFTALTSDGLGGSYWSTVSSPMAFVSLPFVSSAGFKTFSFSPASQFVADASFNTLSYMAGTGIEFIPAGVNTSQINGNLFASIEVPGLKSISSGTNAIAFSTFFFSSLGNTLFTTEPDTNTVTYEIRYPFFKVGNTSLPLNDTISSMTFIGSNAMIVSTNNIEHACSFIIGIGISSYTSTGYGKLWENTSTINGEFRSIMESSCVTFSRYSTGIITLSTTNSSNVSTFHRSTVFINSSIRTSISTFSTSASKFYENIKGSVSTFSTLLGVRMGADTVASTNSIFGQSNFIVSSQSTVKNLVYTLQDISNQMSTQIMNSYIIRITSSNLVSTTINIRSTITGTSSYIISNEGPQFSTFSTLMTSTFNNFLISTPRYANIWSTLAYTVYSSVQTAKGTNYDTLLSTCEVSLSSFVKYLTPSSRVFIEYTPCYSFNTVNTANTSTNLYQVSTFLTYNGYTVPNAAFTDYMNPINVYNMTNRFEISTGYLRTRTTYPYIFKHFHSSIMYVDNTKSRIREFNPLGGVVLPSRYLTDCDLSLTTTTRWTNYMSPVNAIAVCIYNATL